MTFAAATLLLGACSAGTEPTVAQVARPANAPATGPAADAIALHTFMFMPSTLRVAVGTTVTWTNQDEIDHTVTSGTPKHQTDVFDGTLPHQNATFETTFSKPGTYPYFCRIHNVMRGEIVVTA